jgi:bZIP transcription factor
MSIMTDEGANASGPDNDGGSSTASAGSNGKEPRPDDKAKRRSKNRVNARRSRERKRLMMDTLQQEHWKLHVENKRIIMDNDKLRQAIATIKALRGKGSTEVSVGKGAPPADTTFPSDLAHPGISNVPTSNSQEGSSETGSSMQQPNVATGNPLLTMWLQQVYESYLDAALGGSSTTATESDTTGWFQPTLEHNGGHGCWLQSTHACTGTDGGYDSVADRTARERTT